MQYSTKCSVAIHCMLVIALYSEKMRLTSQLLAKSAGCNAATIRNLFQQLQDAGLIFVRRGTGGVRLQRPVQQISIWDIFCAVQPRQECEPLRLHPNPFDQCPVGHVIHEVLTEPYAKISEAMERQMRAYTLEMLCQRYETLREKTTNTTPAAKD